MPRKIMPSPALLTTAEAAAHLNISESTLEKKRSYSTDGPPFVDLGGTIRYRLRDLEAWVEERVFRSTRRRRRPRGPGHR